MQDGGASFGTSIEGWREVSRGPGGDGDRQEGWGGLFTGVNPYVMCKLYH